MIELIVASDYLPRFLVVIESLQHMAWWNEAVNLKFRECHDGFQRVALDVCFPPMDEFRVVGWVNHQSDSVVMLVDADEMFRARMHSRRCDLLGRKQSRRETWILVDRKGVLLCCGPAGARQFHTERYRLDMMVVWLRLLHGVVSKCGGSYGR